MEGATICSLAFGSLPPSLRFCTGLNHPLSGAYLLARGVCVLCVGGGRAGGTRWRSTICRPRSTTCSNTRALALCPTWVTRRAPPSVWEVAGPSEDCDSEIIEGERPGYADVGVDGCDWESSLCGAGLQPELRRQDQSFCGSGPCSARQPSEQSGMSCITLKDDCLPVWVGGASVRLVVHVILILLGWWVYLS